MRTARSILVAALTLVLGACGGSKDESTTNAVDFVTLTIAGAAATYSDNVTGVSILAVAGTSSNTLVTLNASAGGASVNFQLSIPAGATGNVGGSVSVIVGGALSCSGAVTVNVSKHGTSLGGEVAGSFGPTSLACPIGPTPQTISASFSATHL